MIPLEYQSYSFLKYYSLQNNVYGGSLSSVYNYDTLFNYTEEKITALHEKYKRLANAEIEDNDTVLLDKQCHFPKSLIKKNKIPIKLTAQGKKIVYNFDPYEIINRINSIKKVKLVKLDNNKAIIFDFETSDDVIFKVINRNYYGSIVLSTETRYYTWDSVIDIYPDNSVSFCKFVKYINSKLVQPSKEEKESIISMLESNQEDQNKLAFDILLSYNNGFVLAHFLNGTFKNFSKKVVGGTSYKYIRSIIHVRSKNLSTRFWCSSEYICALCKVYFSGVSPQCKARIIELKTTDSYIQENIINYYNDITNDA